MTISHFITVHFITLAWWSFILAQVPHAKPESSPFQYFIRTVGAFI